MTFNKKIVPVVAFSMLAGSIVFGVASTSAHNVESEDFQQRLSTKLGIDKEQVGSALEGIREEKSAERRANIEAKLQAKVSDGELSQEQADEFLALMEERRDDMATLKAQDLSRQEFKNKLREHKQVLVDWAEENQLNLSDLINKPVKPTLSR